MGIRTSRQLPEPSSTLMTLALSPTMEKTTARPSSQRSKRRIALRARSAFVLRPGDTASPKSFASSAATSSCRVLVRAQEAPFSHFRCRWHRSIQANHSTNFANTFVISTNARSNLTPISIPIFPNSRGVAVSYGCRSRTPALPLTWSTSIQKLTCWPISQRVSAERKRCSSRKARRFRRAMSSRFTGRIVRARTRPLSTQFMATTSRSVRIIGVSRNVRWFARQPASSTSTAMRLPCQIRCCTTSVTICRQRSPAGRT